MSTGKCPCCGAVVQIPFAGDGETHCRNCKARIQVRKGKIVGTR